MRGFGFRLQYGTFLRIRFPWFELQFGLSRGVTVVSVTHCIVQYSTVLYVGLPGAAGATANPRPTATRGTEQGAIR